MIANLHKKRTPILLILALFLSLTVVLTEMGKSAGCTLGSLKGLTNRFSEMGDAISGMGKKGAKKTNSNVKDFGGLESVLSQKAEEPPGYGIASLIYVDALLLFTFIMMALPIVVKPKWVANSQGIVTIIVSLVTIIFAFFFILKVLVMMLIMIAMMLAIPFGTIIYMILHGSFDTGKAAAILSILMTLKIFCSIAFVAAHEKFLKNLGAILLVGTAFITMIIVSFLHNFLPNFLVSITDCLAAIVNAVIAIVWGIILLISGLFSLIKLILGADKLTY
jgi:hypothetical protein